MESKWKVRLNCAIVWQQESQALCLALLPTFLLLCTNSLHLTRKLWKYLRKLWRCLLGNREMESKIHFLLRLGTCERLNGSVSAPFWIWRFSPDQLPRKFGILDSALASDVHLCSVHLVARLGPVWHTFTTSCFCLVNRNTFQKNFFSQQVYAPLLSCKLQRLLLCDIFTTPVWVWVFLKAWGCKFDQSWDLSRPLRPAVV